MLIKYQTTTLLQIFCQLLLSAKVIFINTRVADDTFSRNSEMHIKRAPGGETLDTSDAV